MGKVLKFLKGKKTYIIALVLAVMTFLLQAGIIDNETYKSILGFLTAAGLMTLRSGINNPAKPTE